MTDARCANNRAKTFALRFPGRATREIVEAETFADALEIANAPPGTTGNGVFRDIAFQMCDRGIAVWPAQEAREIEAANAEFLVEDKSPTLCKGADVGTNNHVNALFP